MEEMTRELGFGGRVEYGHMKLGKKGIPDRESYWEKGKAAEKPKP